MWIYTQNLMCYFYIVIVCVMHLLMWSETEWNLSMVM